MIGPKVKAPTKAEERDAYELATLRDRDTCQRCRTNCGPTARDHRRNRSQGGWTVVSNLQVLGLACHQWKSEHPREAWAEGWAVPSWVHWKHWPARRTVDGREVWVLYDDEGTWEVISDTEARQRIDDGSVPF